LRGAASVIAVIAGIADIADIGNQPHGLRGKIVSRELLETAT